MTLRSPNELKAAAEEHMLDGREAETRDDWAMVMNFIAANVETESAEPACLLMRTIFGAPLEDGEVKEIVEFQIERREEA